MIGSVKVAAGLVIVVDAANLVIVKEVEAAPMTVKEADPTVVPASQGVSLERERKIVVQRVDLGRERRVPLVANQGLIQGLHDALSRGQNQKADLRALVSLLKTTQNNLQMGRPQIQEMMKGRGMVGMKNGHLGLEAAAKIKR